MKAFTEIYENVIIYKKYGVLGEKGQKSHVLLCYWKKKKLALL